MLELQIRFYFLQRKAAVFVSDWLPAVIIKSTDTRSWRDLSRNINTRSRVRLLADLDLLQNLKKIIKNIAYSFCCLYSYW